MAELADALDLGSSEETRTGSTPARRTKQKITFDSDIKGFIFCDLLHSSTDSVHHMCNTFS